MARAGVAAAIIVPRTETIGRAGGQEDPPTVAVTRYPGQFALMVPADPVDGHDIALLDTCVATPEILGVRVSFHQASSGAPHSVHDDDRIESDTAWFWPELVARNLPVTFNAPGKTELLARLATTFPTLKIMVDHLGVGGGGRYADLRPELGPLLSLARYDNVAVKASGLAGSVTERYPFPLLKETVREVIGAFGPERVFWGSNYSRSPYPYERLVSFFVDELDFLAADELESVMGAGIARFLGWNAPGARA
jgi:predicted TIM-barrel fold metal-dependent hydrolase